MPDPEALKRHNLGTYEEVVLKRIALPGAITIERLEKGVLTGFVTSVTIDGEVKAEISKDGRERVWEVFQQKQSAMREMYLRRYEIEKYDLGAVNFELKDREDALKRIRYENNDSRSVYAMMEALHEAHQIWQGNEPLPDPKLTEEAYEAQLAGWLKTLTPLLDAWLEEARKLDLNERELAALLRAREIEEQRADIQALRFGTLRFRVAQMRAAEERATYEFRTPDGRSATLHLFEVVRAFRPNDNGLIGKLGIYGSRVWEFLTDDPRESNTEGGIWPVILGTLVMTLLMCVAVVPFGVIAALYLREYARQGAIVSAVRIAVNNLAGVPSIVFGIFGLGFFCVVMGGTIDDLLFPELQPAPVFGGGGILWASLTLALLTVPVVIVSTEEALSAVPASQREASLACGASKFQTISKVILPQAMPGILTGTILAMARGAGEVAPLMLVGAVKYALFPPIDGTAPFIHLERKFMHLGFHIYDVGFQSPNVDNTKPLVFATALVLIVLVGVLNIFAINLRNRLRKKYATSAV
ncbi:MAG: phosphate ABC transporter permease PstA [Planctomycetes bacterium]|nr:phosphate ABC transporter permease PstA [Planctomycetota bacterium]